MRASNKRLTILSELERFALYTPPDFDENQRNEFLIFTETELQLILSRPAPTLRLYCAIQLGYFKAKQLFFRLSWNQIDKEDILFLMQNYFSDQIIDKYPSVTKREHYYQCNIIANLFDYHPWSQNFTFSLHQQATQIAQRDITPHFIALELISSLKKQKIIRPKYSTLQKIISSVLTAERNRLSLLITEDIDEQNKNLFQQLLQRDDSLSELAVLKQDAKNFKFSMMTLERRKRDMLKPLYQLAQELLPKLNISKQNIFYYASLANYYTIYELRTLPMWQTQLYILCYSWQRYQQFNDNLIDAIGYYMTQFNKTTKEESKNLFLQVSQKQKSILIGKLLLLFVDENLYDTTPFGKVRQQAFTIMPKKDISTTSEQLCAKQNTQLFYRWQAIDKCAKRFKKHFRPLFMTLDFISTDAAPSPWLDAINWFKKCFSLQQNLSRRPISECPANTIPHRLEPYLYKDEYPRALNADRYEIWVYQQLYKRFHTGAVYLKDSIHYKSFREELLSADKKEAAIKQLNIPWFQKPLEQQLDSLFAELHKLWIAFDISLKQGKLKHLNFDKRDGTLTWRKPRANTDETVKQRFYGKIPTRDLTKVLRLVNKECNFLSAFIPLQPRSAKDAKKEENLLAVLTAQATNRSNNNMAEICDVSYSELETTYQQCFRLATLKEANDIIIDAASELSIFPYYSLDLTELYGPVDGQKYITRRSTIKSRNSKKYFKRGAGVVAFTLLVNHAALATEIIGAHDPESYFAFDIYYNNTSNIIPTVITGDMHVLNKANFALMYCFGPRLEVRFTNLQDQLKHLYCGYDCSDYENFLIKPVGQIDRQLIVNEKENIDTIIATLGQKGITQSDLVRKMCTHTQNSTFKAIFELDKLIRSIYTLRYFLDIQLEKKVHRSQNQIESYHQLRSFIARVGGEKELAGRSDIAVAISNQCGRLIANAIYYYNSRILSLLYKKYEAEKNARALAFLRRVSPIAWQHLHFDGHYTFCSDEEVIDLEAIVANLVLD